MTALLLGLVLLMQPAGQFPGQQELAAGMACWEALDSDCARRHLEESLEKLDPDNDPHYMEHVTLARWTLTLIRLAADDLAGAEQELRLLLLLDPAFTLPEGEHPPKIRYIFEQAKEQIEQARRQALKTPVPETTPPAEETPAVTVEPPPPVRRDWSFEVQGRLPLVFGRDAEVLHPGAGVTLAASRRLSPWFKLAVEAGWSRHELKDGTTALQEFTLGVAGEVPWQLGPVEMALRAGVAALALGTYDRYDNLGAVLSLGPVLAWPADTRFSLRLWLAPALALASSGTSFFLPLGLGGRLEW